LKILKSGSTWKFARRNVQENPMMRMIVMIARSVVLRSRTGEAGHQMISTPTMFNAARSRSGQAQMIVRASMADH
jgi:hypothetical protein